MRILLLDSAEIVIVETLAIVLNRAGWEARPAHTSAEAVQLVIEFQPDWIFIILNNIIDAKPHDVVLEVLRLHPSCKFFLTTGHPMPEFEERLWDAGYALRTVLPLPVHPHDLLQVLNNEDSMILPVKQGQAPKFIMFREMTGSDKLKSDK